ncbi:MAG TPA: PepSY-like domain-containing protein [Bryobacteraceae bacterium]|nr:PepSY-like domain-containing protein [Bryobacteraceae bacterium]
MKYQSLFSALLLVGGLAVADTAVPFSKLPAAVQQAAKTQLQGAQIVGASTEKENGRTTYEVETKLDGKSRDMSFDRAGKLLEVEQQVDMDNIPAAAKAAIQKRVAGGTIRKVESVTAGNSVSYEATVTTKSGRHTEIAVNADGSPRRD